VSINQFTSDVLACEEMLQRYSKLLISPRAMKTQYPTTNEDLLQYIKRQAQPTEKRLF